MFNYFKKAQILIANTAFYSSLKIYNCMILQYFLLIY